MLYIQKVHEKWSIFSQMEKARKKIASAIDGIKNLVVNIDFDVDEKISSENCCLTNIVRHGFPEDPRCLAYDPVQKLLAVGSGHGCIRLLGKASVDYHLKHNIDEPVTHVQFLVNEGGFITALRDDSLHLWNYRQKKPGIVHSLKLSKEHITCTHLPFQSKWLYVGTDRGNVYFVCLATFELSTYVINWNKAIDLSCRTHPGGVRQLALCPTDQSRLLIVFDKGPICIWNLQARESERFATDQPPVRCANWQYDGKQFICGHANGSLTVWSLKKSDEPVQKTVPHGANCRAITHLIWQHNNENEPIVAFAGGMPNDDGVLPALTVLRAKSSATVLEMDHPIIAICPLNSSPFSNIPQHPAAIGVLLKNDLIVVDLTTPGYPCFESPYPMDIHESPVTYVAYFSDCPVDLTAALILVGRNQRRQGARVSDKPFPITGGMERECATGHQELLLTGHEDGSLKFWHASSENLHAMYKLKTGRHFEKIDDTSVVSYAVTDVRLCLDSRLLLVSSACGQVTLFRFVKTESSQEISVVTLAQLCSSFTIGNNNGDENHHVNSNSSSTRGELKRQVEAVLSNDSRSTITTECSEEVENLTPIKVRGGALRRPAGYQPELLCQIPWGEGHVPEKITAMALNSAYGVVAIGTYAGVALVDIVTYTLIYSWSNTELYGRESITAMALNSAYGVVAIGTYAGVALVDIVTYTLIYSWSNTELYGRESVNFSLPSQNSDASPLEPPQTPTASEPAHGKPFNRRSLMSRVSSKVKETVHTSSSSAELVSLDKTSEGGQQEKPNESYLSIDKAQINIARRKSMPSRAHLTLKLNMEARDGGASKEATTPRLLTPQSAMVVFSDERMSMSSPPSALIENEEGYIEKPDDAQQRTQSVRKIVRKLTNKINLRRIKSFHNHDPKSPSTAEPEGYQEGDFILKDPPQQASRSPSLSSLDRIGLPECVTSLTFINCCSKKGNSKSEPCLWLGMSTGACVAFNLILPADRIVNSVVVAPSGSVIRLQDQVLFIGFLNRQFCVIEAGAEQYKDPNKDSGPTSANLEANLQNKVVTKNSLSPTFTNGQESSVSYEEFSQIAILVSEKEARILSLPGYHSLFHYKPEIPFVKAKTTHVRGYPTLMCLNAAGSIVILSLPSLRLLFQSQLFRSSVDIGDPICQKTDLSENGLGVYMATPSEIQKFTTCSELSSQVAECSGELFVPCDMPEPPKTSFFKGVSTLFGNQKDSIDLDAIFNENPSTTATAGMKSVARIIPSASTASPNMDHAHSKGISAGQAATMAIQNLHERGDRLNAVVDATENLRNNAMNLQSRSSKLVEKYEKKKWYQL
uniref:V-SNARE coiled-coil homology domain-containing protein n=1 Tax=Acrobeloides nanus TaxID=290746 RepID=A0A914BVM7_9BILA